MSEPHRSRQRWEGVWVCCSELILPVQYVTAASGVAKTRSSSRFALISGANWPAEEARCRASRGKMSRWMWSPLLLLFVCELQAQVESESRHSYGLGGAACFLPKMFSSNLFVS